MTSPRLMAFFAHAGATRHRHYVGVGRTALSSRNPLAAQVAQPVAWYGDWLRLSARHPNGKEK